MNLNYKKVVSQICRLTLIWTLIFKPDIGFCQNSNELFFTDRFYYGVIGSYIEELEEVVYPGEVLAPELEGKFFTFKEVAEMALSKFDKLAKEIKAEWPDKNVSQLIFEGIYNPFWFDLDLAYMGLGKPDKYPDIKNVSTLAGKEHIKNIYDNAYQDSLWGIKYGSISGNKIFGTLIDGVYTELTANEMNFRIFKRYDLISNSNKWKLPTLYSEDIFAKIHDLSYREALELLRPTEKEYLIPLIEKEIVPRRYFWVETGSVDNRFKAKKTYKYDHRDDYDDLRTIKMLNPKVDLKTVNRIGSFTVDQERYLSELAPNQNSYFRFFALKNQIAVFTIKNLEGSNFDVKWWNEGSQKAKGDIIQFSNESDAILYFTPKNADRVIYIELKNSGERPASYLSHGHCVNIQEKFIEAGILNIANYIVKQNTDNSETQTEFDRLFSLTNSYLRGQNMKEAKRSFILNELQISLSKNLGNSSINDTFIDTFLFVIQDILKNI